ncbi:MAG: uL15 family ribosomal protein [Candidatus Woesearchaeota archaeon]|jgi:ribosomal protein L15|nr:uL15 family ribosomal protein [Candidatus Woesearchaeota archaeon]MDP7181779.1 uL15 family ribosomal protein [Candidatus Woesearchaeota archaeon]MDP7198868.1 uL15 family ribosomal protein [Candidatus Woesearchaeota archaeon]MDP7467132.1 uL15 family ribosomal protein [Candidatus Woesearchaeota archaeon]MDP7647533.1 uL15 family ribosomal protein [Candidatus Woesearchaeota archaeon]
MVVRKRKKITRQRGHRKTGWGKEHRGAGQKGGAGNSASGKRAQAKKPSHWGRKFGGHGFVSRIEQLPGINLGQLDAQLEILTKKGKVKNTAGTYEVNLALIKRGKVLGHGNTTQKIKLTGKASARAKEKIEKAGGTIA